MLERVALHQTRFRTPGVAPDARRVVVGPLGLFLFPSLDRLVTFLRGYAEEGSLDELLPTTEIRTVVTPLRTREVVLTVHAESSHRMDRLASVARLARGMVFTGTQRHFVQYRDAGSALGYDVRSLVDEPADLILYHNTFQQTYRFERAIAPRELILRLTPERLPPGRRAPPERVLATAEPGVGHALMSYLARSAIPARVAHVQWTTESAFDPGPRRAHLLDLAGPPERIVRLLDGLPGVRVYVPSAGAAVELGYRHPIPLEACRSLFEDDAVYLLGADGAVLHIAPAPVAVPVASVTRVPVWRSERDDRAGAPSKEAPALALPLRVVPSATPRRPAVAAFVPHAQRAWLGRLLYALPPHVLSALRIASAEDGLYLLAEEGLEGVPLGTAYRRVAPGVYLPAGHAFSPAVGPRALDELLPSREGAHWFFGADGEPRVVADAAFGSVARMALAPVRPLPMDAEPLPDAERPLTLIEYDEPRRFPLWGVPGRTESTSGDEGTSGAEEA